MIIDLKFQLSRVTLFSFNAIDRENGKKIRCNGIAASADGLAMSLRAQDIQPEMRLEMKFDAFNSVTAMGSFDDDLAQHQTEVRLEFIEAMNNVIGVISVTDVIYPDDPDEAEERKPNHRIVKVLNEVGEFFDMYEEFNRLIK